VSILEQLVDSGWDAKNLLSSEHIDGACTDADLRHYSGDPLFAKELVPEGRTGTLPFGANPISDLNAAASSATSRTGTAFPI
jgi:hypothetical protein